MDIYPQHEHSQHVKYVQPSHIAPVKYIQQPQHVKYIEKPQYEKHMDYDEPAQYEYGYTVHDDQSGDYKMHTEKRDGDTVRGRYEVLDPDGFKRIVEYTADGGGFNAVVHREPTDVKVPVKVVQKVYEPQPVKYISQPHPTPKYYEPQHKYYEPQQKYYEPRHKYYEPQPVHQKVIIPQPTPQYYAAPERPKYYREPNIVKHAYAQSQPTVKYVTPAPHYPHHY